MELEVAVSMRERPNAQQGRQDYLEEEYVKYFGNAGICLTPLSNEPALAREKLLELRPRGILLSGGNSLDPALYESIDIRVKDYSLNRDIVERMMMGYALENNLPVLGICRGMQFINVYFGGKLSHFIQGHAGTRHYIETTGKFLPQILTEVNSFHNHGITAGQKSAQLDCFALAEDGSVEGLYHPHYPIAGIMWHPERERQQREIDAQIIDKFLNWAYAAEAK